MVNSFYIYISVYYIGYATSDHHAAPFQVLVMHVKNCFLKAVMMITKVLLLPVLMVCRVCHVSKVCESFLKALVFVASLIMALFIKGREGCTFGIIIHVIFLSWRRNWSSSHQSAAYELWRSTPF